MNIPEIQAMVQSVDRSAASVERPAALAKEFGREPRVSRESAQAERQDDVQHNRPPMSPEQAHEVVRQANESLQSQNVQLAFNVIEESGEVQVELLDKESGKVIRKIPDDDLLRLSDSLKQYSSGFVNEIS